MSSDMDVDEEDIPTSSSSNCGIVNQNERSVLNYDSFWLALAYRVSWNCRNKVEHGNWFLILNSCVLQDIHSCGETVEMAPHDSNNQTNEILEFLNLKNHLLKRVAKIIETYT